MTTTPSENFFKSQPQLGLNMTREQLASYLGESAIVVIQKLFTPAPPKQWAVVCLTQDPRADEAKEKVVFCFEDIEMARTLARQLMAEELTNPINELPLQIYDVREIGPDEEKEPTRDEIAARILDLQGRLGEAETRIAQEAEQAKQWAALQEESHREVMAIQNAQRVAYESFVLSFGRVLTEEESQAWHQRYFREATEKAVEAMQNHKHPESVTPP